MKKEPVDKVDKSIFKVRVSMACLGVGFLLICFISFYSESFSVSVKQAFDSIEMVYFLVAGILSIWLSLVLYRLQFEKKMVVHVRRFKTRPRISKK